MKSNYRKLGDFIRPIDERNNDGSLGEDNLYGISVTKEFIPTHANLVGVTFDGYKTVSPRQFAYIPDTSRRGDKIAISLNLFGESIIVSSICSVFEIVDESRLLPEYLMLWFKRPEFDRYARFMSNGSAREVFDWDCMCGVELPIPSILEQKKIVGDYTAISQRIDLLNRINRNLLNQCEALYKKLTDEREFNGKFEDIAEISSGKRPDDLAPGNIPLLGAGGIMDYISEYNYDVPSLVIGRVGTHGIVQRANRFWASDNTLVIITKYYEYAYQFLKRVDYDSLNRGSTQPLITQGDLKKVEIYIPDDDDLQRYENAAGSIMQMYSRNEKEVALLTNMKEIIISHLC